MPDDAAAFARALSLQQAFYRKLHGAELLVVPHHFDGRTLLVGGEEGEGADDVEQIVAVKHPGNQTLLVIWAAVSMLQLINRTRKGIRPALKVFLAVGRNSPELCFLAAGGDDELVVVEERRATLAVAGPTIVSTLLAVTQKLVNGFGYWLLYPKPFPNNICGCPRTNSHLPGR